MVEHHREARTANACVIEGSHMSTATQLPPQPGQVVRVRCRRYLVEKVEPGPHAGDLTAVHLSCLEDDAQGEPLECLWETEVAPLAKRTTERPALQVKLYVNLPTENGRGERFADERAATAHLKSHLAEEWPGPRPPEVYYDRRSLTRGAGCLHAKCVIIDEELAFVTSANFTEAAQVRNIEAGVIVRSVPVVRALRHQYMVLTGGPHPVLVRL